MTGLRLPLTKLRSRVKLLKAKAEARQFLPEVREFAKKVLTTCARETPIRHKSKITAAQKRQYQLRIDNIPTNHHLVAPSLRVKADGSHWIFAGGAWYRGDWRLPAHVHGIYQELLGERRRRMAKPVQSEFIEGRAQSRFLYRRSWYEAGLSIGISIPVSQDVIASHTRRKPPKAPHRAYAQERGGKTALSYVVYNPFLEQPSRYKPFSGKRILASATKRHRAAFMSKVRAKARKIIANASRN